MEESSIKCGNQPLFLKGGAEKGKDNRRVQAGEEQKR